MKWFHGHEFDPEKWELVGKKASDMSKKVLAQFHWDRGRLGEVFGLFVARLADLESAYGKRVYFGEILGKHSDISGILEASDFKILTDEQPFVHKLVTLLGQDTISGYNPLKYLEED